MWHEKGERSERRSVFEFITRKTRQSRESATPDRSIDRWSFGTAVSVCACAQDRGRGRNEEFGVKNPFEEE
ncbi:unnamed protein product [Calypogeia fissa]